MDYQHLRDRADRLLAASSGGPWRLEISGGRIIVVTSPVGRHLGLVRAVRQQLEAQLPGTRPGFLADGGVDLEDAALGVRRVPDLMVFHQDLLQRDEPATPNDVLLVCEVVPADPGSGLEGKLRDYAAMGIAHYLVVDPRHGVTHAHAGPAGPPYATQRQYPFGAPVDIGPWRIDTRGFSRYGDTR
jgi:Uma2 family endonuclease